MSGTVSDSICSLRHNHYLKDLKVDCEFLSCACCDNCMVDPREQAIQDRVSSISFHRFVDADVRAQALEWIINGDEGKLSADSKEFDQRYILAVFYYSFDGDHWASYAGDGGHWLSKDSYCSWYGVTCDSKGEVKALHLASLNLKGLLPYEIGSIQSLVVINLSNNKISGEIPKEIR